MRHQDTISSWSLAALTYFSIASTISSIESFLDNQFNVIQSQFLRSHSFVRSFDDGCIIPPQQSTAAAPAVVALLFYHVRLWLAPEEEREENRYKKKTVQKEEKNLLSLISLWSLHTENTHGCVSNFMAIKINLKMSEGRGFALVSVELALAFFWCIQFQHSQLHFLSFFVHSWNFSLI